MPDNHLLDDSALAANIRSALAHIEAGVSVQHFRETASTNDSVCDALQQNATVAVAVADTQSGGRGSHGRSWSSNTAHNLYMSVALRLATDRQALEGLSLAIGVVLRQQLLQLSLIEEGSLRLKWPNDLVKVTATPSKR